MSSVSWTQRIRLQQLRVVLAIYEQASLLKAAEALRLTQPAVSKALKEIEADLGVALFQRTNRGVQTTPYGEALVLHIRKVFSQLEQAADDVAGLKQGIDRPGGRRHADLGVGPAASAHHCPLAPRSAGHPGFRGGRNLGCVVAGFAARRP